MGETQEGILSGLTVKAIALGVILAAFNLWVMAPIGVIVGPFFTPYFIFDNVHGERSMWVRILPQVFLSSGTVLWACMIMLLINKSRPNTFTLQEAATVFTITFCAGILGADFGGVYGLGDISYSVISAGPSFVHYVKEPELLEEMFGMLPSMFPNQAISTYQLNELLKPRTGVWSINMAYWGGLMGYTWLKNLGYVFMFVGLANLLRRQFVEVESLGFPFATVATEIAQISQPSTSKVGNILKNKYFIVGFIIMAVWSLAAEGGAILTNNGSGASRAQYIKAIIPYRQPAWQLGTMVPLLENIGYNFWPFFIGWCYLWPIAELGGGLVGSALLLIWMTIAFNSGIEWIYQDKVTGVRGSSIDNPLHILLDRWYMVQFGFVLALVIIPAIRHRKLLIASLKGLFEEPNDPNKPVSYRMSWLILLAGFVLLLIAGAMIGVHMGMWIVFLIGASIVSIGLIRVVSANGGFWFLPWRHAWASPWTAMIGLPVILIFGGLSLDWTGLISGLLLLSGDYSRVLYGAIIAAVVSLAFYKVGELTKTKGRSILVAALIGLSLVSILLLTFNAMLQEYVVTGATQFYGGQTLRNYWNAMKNNAAYPLDAYTSWTQMGGAQLWQFPEYSVLGMGIGFLIILVVTMLQQRFSWFIVAGTGIFTGTMFGSQLWIPMLLAIILKYITVRVGGTTRYESVGKPMAVGLILGTMFVFVFQALVWYANIMAAA